MVQTTTAPAAEATLSGDRMKGCCQPVARPIPEPQAERLATLHRALSDPTRIQMLHMLKAASQPICVCDFTAAFELSQPTVSHHLGRLREAGLVSSFRRGIWAFYRLRPDLDPAAAAALALVP